MSFDPDGFVINSLTYRHSATDDPDHSVDENRYLNLGKSYNEKHLVVSYTERDERIRIISVRPMTPRERRAYD